MNGEMKAFEEQSLNGTTGKTVGMGKYKTNKKARQRRSPPSLIFRAIAIENISGPTFRNPENPKGR